MIFPMFVRHVVVAALGILLSAPAGAADATRGRQIAHAQEKGNCLACHRIPSDPGAETNANLGPVLENLSARYPNRAALRRQVWDASRANPDTIMPPYGRHRILTETEIDDVVEYLRGL